MFIAPKRGSILLALSLLLSGIVTYGQATGPGQSSPSPAQAVPEPTARSLEQKGVRSAEIPDVPEEPPEDEFAPAAVEMDVSQESPLLQVLYKATTLVFTGCTTSVCVESTLRDAFFRDYLCVLVEDCVAERPGR